MLMNVYRETAILKDADEPTRKMLTLWHDVCRAVLKHDLEVGVASRREYDLTKEYAGELNTAVPMLVEGIPLLVLLFDNTAHVEEVILTHELGHWILKLQGFKGIQRPTRPHSNEEIYFNSMCHHPALYVLQRSMGHDPQPLIDERARHNLSIFKPEPFTLYQQHRGMPAAENPQRVLLFADDILNCSPDIASAQLVKLDGSFPNDAKCIRDICDIRASIEPSKLDTHPAFVQAVKQRLCFGEDWLDVDEIPGLKALIGGKN